MSGSDGATQRRREEPAPRCRHCHSNDLFTIDAGIRFRRGYVKRQCRRCNKTGYWTRGLSQAEADTIERGLPPRCPICGGKTVAYNTKGNVQYRRCKAANCSGRTKEITERYPTHTRPEE